MHPPETNIRGHKRLHMQKQCLLLFGTVYGRQRQV